MEEVPTADKYADATITVPLRYLEDLILDSAIKASLRERVRQLEDNYKQLDEMFRAVSERAAQYEEQLKWSNPDSPEQPVPESILESGQNVEEQNSYAIPTSTISSGPAIATYFME